MKPEIDSMIEGLLSGLPTSNKRTAIELKLRAAIDGLESELASTLRLLDEAGIPWTRSSPPEVERGKCPRCIDGMERKIGVGLVNCGGCGGTGREGTNG